MEGTDNSPMPLYIVILLVATFVSMLEHFYLGGGKNILQCSVVTPLIDGYVVVLKP
jgi:hypothetical protein